MVKASSSPQTGVVGPVLAHVGAGVVTLGPASGLPQLGCLTAKPHLVPENGVGRIQPDRPWPGFGIPCRHQSGLVCW